MIFWIRIILIGIALAGAGSWFATKLYRAYVAGEEKVIKKVEKETEHVEAEWDRIDRLPDDFHGSIGRLRDRAKGGR